MSGDREPDSQTSIRFGAYELQVSAQELRRDGRQIRLAPQALRILIELTATPGVLVTREHLRTMLWSDGTHVDFDRSLNTAVRKLRRALRDEADHPLYIQTVVSRGYRFIAPVVPAAETETVATVHSSTTESTNAVAGHAWDRRGLRRELEAASSPGTKAGDVAKGPASPREAAVAQPLASAASEERATALTAASDDSIAITTVATPLVSDRVGAALMRTDTRMVTTSGGHPSFAARRHLSLGAALRSPKWAALLLLALLPAGWVISRNAFTRSADASLVASRDGSRMRAAVAAAVVEPAALEAYRRGQAVARRGRPAALSVAVDAFERAVQTDAAFAPAWAALARARATRAFLDGRDRSELQGAQTEAQRALAADRDLVDAQMAMGQVRFALDRDFVAAEAWFRRAASRGSRAHDVLWLAIALNAQARYDEALAVVDDGLAREPRAAVLHAWRGLLLHALHRYDEELPALTQATAIDDQSTEAWFHLGMGYARRGDYARALPLLQRAAHLSGEGGYYVSWLGRVAADAGDLSTAEQALNQLDHLSRTRGLAPALRSAVIAHLDANRTRIRQPQT